ncbi:hypothetical protein HPB50_000605 [Hyalomma asiaticum]|uniref:Uncharacterized protein n=1 Tax=Hyalomma asiaticum TaxID=266040 RepID=A0ACB7RKL7_HYAAI|nr:hypothetical protein HPB50_000605 [Hyalomma asiaticum]
MRTCCVLRCRSGYQWTKEKVSLFALPSDPEMRSKWIQAIARPETAKFSFSSRHVRVCEKHFHPEDIVRYDEYVIQGTAVRLERHRSKPRPHAVPRIFESPELPKENSTRVPRPSRKRKPLGPSRELSGTQTSQILRTCGSEENAQPVIVEIVSKPPSARGCGDPVATDIVIKTEPPDASDDFLERACSDTCTQDGHEHECKMCHKIFNTCLHLLQHSVVHSKELQFMCMNCGAVFLHQEDKAKHEGMHTSRQLYWCVRCGESSPNETTFRQHILDHYGQPSFHCHLCPMLSLKATAYRTFTNPPWGTDLRLPALWSHISAQTFAFEAPQEPALCSTLPVSVLHQGLPKAIWYRGARENPYR